MFVDGAHTEFLENSVFLAQEEAVCCGGGGANPGVAEADCACLVVKVTEAAHEAVSKAT